MTRATDPDSRPTLSPAWNVTWPFDAGRPVWACGEYIIPHEGCFELNCTEAGEGRVLWFAPDEGFLLETTESPARLTLGPNEWLLGPPVACTWLCGGKGVRAGYIWSPDLARLCEGFPDRNPAVMSVEACDFARQLHRCLNCPLPGRFGCWRLSTQLFEALLEPDLSTKSSDSAVAQALTRIAAAREQFPTQAEVAAAVGLSSSQFARRFQQATGMNFRAFLMRERLTRARVLLRNGRTNVTEAAYLAGYSEVSQFTRAFRRQFGYPPSAARNRDCD